MKVELTSLDTDPKGSYEPDCGTSLTHWVAVAGTWVIHFKRSTGYE